jgi:predicted permease
MDTWLQDARYAVRAFARTPLFTAVAVLTVALGIGANATVFSFVSALLLRPTPGVADPSSLVSVFTSDFSSGPYGATSYPDFETLTTDAGAFQGLAALQEGGVALLRIGDGVERVRVMAVSPEFFSVAGISAAAGRLIGAGDAAPAAATTVVLGHALWQRAFGGDRNAIGQPIALNGVPHTIVGIAPPRFTGMNLGVTIDLWTPLQPDRRAEARQNRGLSVVGRLRAGATIRQAQSQLDAIASRLAAAYPESNRGTLARPDQPRPMFVLRHTRMHPAFRTEVATIGGVLLAAVGMVLLIACANVAALLLSRATARRREVAVRQALGATRRRLLRQMLTESVMLAIAGGGVGLLFALWTADALPSFFPAEEARMLDAHVDGRVLAFTAGIALLSGVMVGLAPAFHGMRSGTLTWLRAEGGHVVDGRFGTRSRQVLVVVQIALATVLLIGAALLTRSLGKALDADLGFETRNAVLVSIEIPVTRSFESVRTFYETAAATVAALPGIESAGLARFVPVAGTSRRGFSMDGYTPRPGEDRELHYNLVSRGFLETMGIKVVAGRLFGRADTATSPRVVVVNELLANRYYGGQAVGRRIRDSAGTDLEIVGVVRASRRLSLQEPPTPVVFYPLEQQPTRRVILAARTAGDPARAMETVRQAIIAHDRDAAAFRTVTLEAHLAEALAANRLTAALVGTCGLMAVLLAIVGVYGVVAFAVARRTREIGVRVALGASPGQIFRLVIGEGGGIVLLGIATGAVAAVGASRLLGSMLYGVSATDPATFLLVPGLLAAVAVAASCLPAARAVRMNPVAALRHD